MITIELIRSLIVPPCNLIKKKHKLIIYQFYRIPATVCVAGKHVCVCVYVWLGGGGVVSDFIFKMSSDHQPDAACRLLVEGELTWQQGRRPGCFSKSLITRAHHHHHHHPNLFICLNGQAVWLLQRQSGIPRGKAPHLGRKREGVFNALSAASIRS